MAIPDTDIARVRRWCIARVPEHARHQVGVDYDLADRHITIVETRAPWDGSNRDWTRAPIARLHYTASRREWTLYWRDRNHKFHRYDQLDPTPDVERLLDHIANSGDPVFWG
ncbi:DUF3024 domain-containing protein [Gordonia rhizosphera]|uniref:DUF3024 domain-containing protein n=1 Tax=Gordonia rhizosphera TaxID=83341 RepID=UPI00031144C2|nr:DUF3024 domain-containing protein [Gordonia rhizosphera]